MTVTTERYAAYKALRAKHYLPAKVAVQWLNAKDYRQMEPRLTWGEDRHHYVPHGTGVVNGYDVVVSFAPADYPSDAIHGTFTDDYVQGAVRNPAWSHRNPNRVYKWYVPEGSTVSDLFEWHNGQGGMSKSVALAMAEEAIMDEARIMAEPEVWDCIVTASKAGVELGRVVFGAGACDPNERNDDYLISAVYDYDLIGEAVEKAEQERTRLLAALAT